MTDHNLQQSFDSAVMSDNVNIKQEVKTDDQESNNTEIKVETDIEEKVFYSKTELTAFESHYCPIKSEKQEDLKLDPVEVDPLAIGACEDAKISVKSRDSEKKINSGDESPEESVSNENTVQTSHLQDNSSEKIHECTICKKKFATPSKLTIHSRIHTGEKPYECHICQKKFAQFTNLTSHLRVHTGEKPYQCTVCEKTFSHSYTLGLHARVHTGEEPYECNICNKKFARSSNLTSHLRTHTGEKPYECNVCKKRFARSAHLTGHSLVHSGKRSYECSICKKKFSSSPHLDRHVRLHSKRNT